MTRATLKARVSAILRTAGANRTLTDGTSMDDAVNEGLLAFSVETKAFWEDGQSLAVSTSDRKAALPSGHGDIFLPRLAAIDAGAWLLDHRGRVGPCQVDEIAALRPDLATAGTPGRWAWSPPGTILFDRPFAANSTVRIAGWKRHALLATDGAAVELGDEWQDGLAAYLASRIAFSDGLGSTLEKASALSGQAAQDLGRLLAWIERANRRWAE